MTTYTLADCVVFFRVKEAYGGLSNMAGGFPIPFGDKVARTSEALYQMCRFPAHPEVQQQILDQKSPMGAKMVAKKYVALTRTDWNHVRVPVMRWCLEMKLFHNFESFNALLQSTGKRAIVERSSWDPFWGALLQPDGTTLEGANKLGQLLMVVRGLALDWVADPNPNRKVWTPVEDVQILGYTAHT